MKLHRPRRRALLALAATGAAWPWGALAAAKPWTLRVLPTPEPMRRVHAGGPSGLLGLGASGSLWALSAAGRSARRLAADIDPASRIGTGHGRVAARTARGGLWVLDGARASTLVPARLAADAGLLVLPWAVLAVVTLGDAASEGPHRVARFEPDPAGQWREVAVSKENVLPDARPVQVDLDGRGDGGHIAVLGGPDGRRYAHGVLGDAIEATQLLWLERHGLAALRSLSLPAPYVFEDTVLRPVQMPDGRAGAGLLTVRSGPDGGQLVLVTADAQQPRALRVAALGDTVGGFHRWLAPTVQGRHLLAVHTPHIGGVLHVYRPEGERLVHRRLVGDVNTHAIPAGAVPGDAAGGSPQRRRSA